MRALAVRGTKARLASYDDFVAVHHHEKAHAGSPIIGSSLSFLTALQEFETRLGMPPEEDIEEEPNDCRKPARDSGNK